MVQSVLFFVLGFLCAAFLALVVAPAFWRRAVSLTRRRVEASIPLTQSEIQARMDQLRAEFAMSARRLEMTVQALREKVAVQAVEIGRAGEELRKARADGRQSERDSKALEAEGSELKSRLHASEDEVARLKERLGEVERLLKERDDEYRNAMRLYEDASFSSSNRQIELAAREAELEKLATDMAALRSQHKAADRREKEAGRLSRRPQAVTANAAPLDAAADADDNGDAEAAVARLAADRDRLEEGLLALAKEGTPPKSPATRITGMNGAHRQGAAFLREQMGDLAARVVDLAIRLDGPGSPIAKALDGAPAGRPGADGAASLADRVRALRKSPVPL